MDTVLRAVGRAGGWGLRKGTMWYLHPRGFGLGALGWELRHLFSGYFSPGITEVTIVPLLKMFGKCLWNQPYHKAWLTSLIGNSFAYSLSFSPWKWGQNSRTLFCSCFRGFFRGPVDSILANPQIPNGLMAPWLGRWLLLWLYRKASHCVFLVQIWICNRKYTFKKSKHLTTHFFMP